MSGSRTKQYDGMGSGAFVSALLHGSVIALALIAWPRLMPPVNLDDQVVPVDVMPISEETNVAPQVKAEKPPEQPAPEPTPPPPEPTASAAAEAPPPPPPDEVAPLPLPDTPPPPPIPPKPQPTPPPQRFADVHPRTKPKPEKAKPAFDAAFLDKIGKNLEKTPPAPTQTPTKQATAPKTVTGVGAQTAMTMSELDALRQQMQRCWNLDPGSPDPASLVLQVKVTLNQDGTVSGNPTLLDTSRMSDPYYRVAAESALRAVKMCGPYKLPAEKYESWRELEVTFDPSKRG